MCIKHKAISMNCIRPLCSQDIKLIEVLHSFVVSSHTFSLITLGTLILDDSWSHDSFTYVTGVLTPADVIASGSEQ